MDHPDLPPRPTAEMTAAERAAQVRSIVLAVIGWLAGADIEETDEMADVTDPAANQTLASELANGLGLTKTEEAKLYMGLETGQWATVGDLIASMIQVVEKHFPPQPGAQQ